MHRTAAPRLILLLTICALLAPAPVLAERIEDIVAWVNGEIITKTEYEEEEGQMIAEVYRRFTGAELDERIKEIRDELLIRMIDRKILLHHARTMPYDFDRMAQGLYEDFRDDQMERREITEEVEFEKVLESDGLSVSDVKQRLIEINVPDYVLQLEVGGRISVADHEIERYYNENLETFFVQGEVTLREIVLLAASEEDRRTRRTEMEAIHRQLLDGADFSELAIGRSESGTSESGGLLDPIKQEDLSPALRGPAFSLEPGGISEIIEAPYGLHLLRVESRVDPHTMPLEEIRDDVRSFLMNRKYATELAAFMEKAREDAEWCVKTRYRKLLSIPPPESCDRL